MTVALSLSAALSISSPSSQSPNRSSSVPQNRTFTIAHAKREPSIRALTIQGSSSSSTDKNLRTCKNCKTQFDPLLNHPRACRFHTAHFGGETKRKFESVYSGGTMNTPDSGKVYQYWHCCGSEDPFDLGCTEAPHASYDD